MECRSRSYIFHSLRFVVKLKKKDKFKADCKLDFSGDYPDQSATVC